MDGPMGDVPRQRQGIRQQLPWSGAGATTATATAGIQYWADGVGNALGPRRLPEQCDNGGLTLHGCTRLCQVAAGYECRHWLRSVGTWEIPVFGSRCELKSPAYSWATWSDRRRRLAGEDFGDRYGVHGRLLAHRPITTALRKLPANSAVWEKNALVLYRKAGLNGQIRIIESNLCVPSAAARTFTVEGCFGAVWSYSHSASGTTDKVYLDLSTHSGGSYKGATATRTKQAVAQADHAFWGKQRGVFGPYLVVNKDEFTMEWWGYKGASATDQAWAKLYTSTKVAELQLLGSHEYYYWPGRDMVLARLADGASFRFWRFAKTDFEVAAAANDAVAKIAKKITQTDLALL